METTFYRAKEVQPVVEKMITLGKKGDLAAYRKALSFITKEDVAHKLFKEIAPKYADRNGGYTRVTRTGELFDVTGVDGNDRFIRFAARRTALP